MDLRCRPSRRLLPTCLPVASTGLDIVYKSFFSEILFAKNFSTMKYNFNIFEKWCSKINNNLV